VCKKKTKIKRTWNENFRAGNSKIWVMEIIYLELPIITPLNTVDCFLPAESDKLDKLHLTEGCNTTQNHV